MSSASRILCVAASILLAGTAHAVGGIPVPEIAQLIGSDVGQSDDFGFSLAVSGDTLVVGAVGKSTTPGAAYVFVWNGGAWIEQAKLTGSDSQPGDSFGWRVDIDGDTIVVSAKYAEPGGITEAGEAYVFARTGTTWTEQAALIAFDAAAVDRFGGSVTCTGDTVVVTTDLDDNAAGVDAGAAYVYTRSGTTWSLQTKLAPNDAGPSHHFGLHAALSGDMLLVSGFPSGGAVYVFERSGTVWTQQDKLVQADGVSGTFGLCIALSGDTALISAFGGSSPLGASAGAAYVFVRNGSVWTQQAKLWADDGANADGFGLELDVDGDTAVVGAYRGDLVGKVDAGVAYVFVRSGTAWQQQAKLQASDAAADKYFGWAVGVEDDIVLVGSPSANNSHGIFAGTTYVFDAGAFEDLLGGLPGTNGIPQLSGLGTLVPGSGGSLALANARPSSLSSLLVSLGGSPLPFKGGVLHTVPAITQISLPTSPTGGWTLPWTSWPIGIPAGTTILFETLVSDPAAVHGVAISNLLQATQP